MEEVRMKYLWLILKLAAAVAALAALAGCGPGAG